MKKYKRVALANRVLAVCVINYDNDGSIFDWAVYIDAVKGVNHDNEEQKVFLEGTKTSKKIAVCLFPFMDGDKYRD